jgi:hypothetical protein
VVHLDVMEHRAKRIVRGGVPPRRRADPRAGSCATSG